MVCFVRIILGVSLLVLPFVDGLAQWERMDGPEGGTVKQLAGEGALLAANLWSGVFVRIGGGTRWVSTGFPDLCEAVGVHGNTLFAASYDQGVYRSTDAGVSWQPCCDTLRYAEPRIIASSSAAIAIASERKGMWVSRDRGDTWQSASETLSNHDFSALSMTGDVLYAAGNYEAGSPCKLYRSTNFGTRWDSLAVPNNPLDRGDIYHLSSLGATVLGSFSRTLIISKDSGAHWTSFANILTIGSIRAVLTTDSALYVAADAGFYRSLDTGSTWNRCGTGMLDTSILSLYEHEGALLAGTRNGGVLSSNDRGATWTASNAGLNESRVNALLIGPDTLYAGTASRGLATCDAEGLRWTIGNIAELPPVRALAADGPELYAGTFQGVFRSADHGATWTDVSAGMNGGDVRSLLMHGNTLFAGGAMMQFTTDGGATWTSPSGTVRPKDITSLAAIGDTILAGTPANATFRSCDGGLTWKWMSSLAVPGVTGLLALDGDFYAATDNGVFRSTDRATTWTSIYSSKADAIGAGSGMLFRSLWSSLYVTTDSGSNWRHIGPGSSANMPRATCIALSGAYLFVGTEEQGIWRRALADIVAVEAIPAHAAASLRIERNVPNPFSAGTDVIFTVSGNQSIALRIYDMTGRLVAVPASGEYRAGTYSVAFDATRLPCGVYVCRLTSEWETVSRTMIVAR